MARADLYRCGASEIGGVEAGAAARQAVVVVPDRAGARDVRAFVLSVPRAPGVPDTGRDGGVNLGDLFPG